MSRSPLFGRRVHVAGSISKSSDEANGADVEAARTFVAALVVELLRDGAAFVVPIDKEPTREDGQPICFDWLVLETIHNHLIVRPKHTVIPLITAVQHHKNEAQIPDNKLKVWESLKEAEGLMLIENAGQWNMNSKRMDIQAIHGDILLTLGGDEGVLYLANLYHDAGKPVIPLNLPLIAPGKGALKLWELASASRQTNRFFRTVTAHRRMTCSTVLTSRARLRLRRRWQP